MKLSRFVLLYKDVGDGEHVLYSVVTGRYLGIDTATLEAIDRWQTGFEPEEPDEISTRRLLWEEGFLSASREEDDARLRDHLDRVSEGIPSTMYVTLMPTLACNLACTYCFQNESPAFNRMTDDVESDSVKWILNRTRNADCRKLIVHYFGGEPLTRKDYVLRTARTFSSAMRARGGDFEWEITTNAIHLDLEFVQAMRAFGEGSIKITLDGDRETHDQLRIYRDGRGTFDTTFANLAAVAGHVRLRLGGNFLAGQEASYERLIQRLEKGGLLDKIEAVRFKPIVDVSRSQRSTCGGCGASGETASTLIQINRSVRQRSSAAGFQLAEATTNPCELHWKNSFTIDPDGGVYKCPAVAGRPEMAITQVNRHDADKPAPLLVYRPWEQCGDCAFLPVCMGGCLGGQYLATGRLDEVACRKPELEDSFRDSVTRRYRVELGDREWEGAAC